MLLSAFSADELRVRAHEYGAARCLWRHCPSCELMAAVRAVLGCPDGGELSPRLTFGGRVLDGETRVPEHSWYMIAGSVCVLAGAGVLFAGKKR